jgi:hypothetical protein
MLGLRPHRSRSLLPPSSLVLDIIILFSSAVITFSLFDFDHANSDSDFRKQRRFELAGNVGYGRFNGCVLAPYWTCVDLGWDCFWVGTLRTVYPIICIRYLEDCRVWRFVSMPRGQFVSEIKKS